MRPYPWLMRQSQLARQPLSRNVLCAIFSGFCLIAQAYLLATLIDRVYLHDLSEKDATPLLGYLLLTIIFRAILTFYREKLGFKTAAIIKNTLRKQLFSKWMSSNLEKFSTEKTGALTTVFIEQIEALHGFFADYLPQMMIVVILPFIILCFVFPENWLAGTLLFITAPLIPLFMAFIGMQTAKLKQENFQLLAKLSAHFLDTLQGLTTLSLFNRARAQTASIKNLSNAFREKTMGILKIAFLSSAALELFATISIAMIAVYLGLGLLGYIHIGFSGVKITLQQALFILLLAPEFFMPLRQLGTFYHARAEAIAAAEEMIPLFNSETDSVETSQKLVSDQIALSFMNVTFSYKNKPIFKNFSLTIPFGGCIAITGESGIGKSTLLHLIAKLITPQCGKITANTVDIATIDNDNYRSTLSLLHQYPRLQTGSIYDNIAFAKKGTTQAEVVAAAEAAGVTLFSTDLSDMIYEQNVGLSGGQIQRIALARIILRDTPIVLFDEPTNYLDESNIEIFWELLNRWYEKKTLIIATHDQKILAKIKWKIDLENHARIKPL
ncbi:MAG: thiol reductant ABC exporter subunit CydD [Coxiellaceae bacterium]|nr:thiol reductant ABC exporter subunit CydD [Coxiellaceae bacterium]